MASASPDSTVLDWLFSAQKFGIKLGLENIRLLLEKAGRPEERLAIIHVAGTNGKGSVCAMVEAILRAAGLRTGLFTSPHLVDFRERIRVDGGKISPADMRDGLTRLRLWSEEEKITPTFFELSTALALDHFVRMGCEAVVLETGMGGRLDATNVVMPRAVVITPIALDHTEWLGETLELVAAEKAGIIKAGRPVCSGPQEARAKRVLEETAARQRAPLRFVTEPWLKDPVALAGSHQLVNASLAVEVVRAAGFAVSDAQIREGLARVVWPGRFQQIGNYLLDGGHNPHAARRLVQTWREVYGARRIPVIFGALGDKDADGILEALSDIASDFCYVPVANPRAVPPSEYPAPPRGTARIFDSLASALRETDAALITGSLFLVGEAMELLGVEP